MAALPSLPASRVPLRGPDGLLARTLTVGRVDNLRLRYALWWLAVAAAVPGLVLIAVHFQLGNDADVPLIAADRWIHGHTPYLAAAFRSGAGLGVPFLYPPYVLAYLAPLLFLPRGLVVAGFVLVGLIAAVVACRRLGVPALAIPLLLLWPPFTEGIWNANVQLVAFAAFAVAFYEPRPLGRWRPTPRILDRSLGLGVGLAGAAVAVIKVSQVQPWVVLLRRAPRTALIAACLAGFAVLVTVPLTGLHVYLDWLAQDRRAADPSWVFVGSSLLRFLPPVAVGIAGTLATAAMLVVGGPEAAAWAGLAAIVAAPNVHTYTWLFLLPAMLLVRREVALLAAIAVASYDPTFQWLGWLAVAGAFALGLRWPAFREPVAAVPGTDAAEAEETEAAGRQVPKAPAAGSASPRRRSRPARGVVESDGDDADTDVDGALAGST
ncbi:MAG TPA: hypothetical protein VF763_07675 [Candidatus Limnocylindrales bacterium]